MKEQKEQEQAARKAARAVTGAINQAKKAHHQAGVNARRAERERKKKMSESQAKGEFVPIELTIPIRDPEKNPTPDELEALQVHPSISQAVPIDPVLHILL